MGAETRILLLSNRDQPETSEDPPLSLATGEGARAVPADSVAPVAASVFETLANTPGVRVAHRTVFHPSEILAAIGDHRPSVVFNLCEALGGDSRLEVHAAWLLERLGLPFTGSPYHALRHCLYKFEANHILARAGVRVPTTVRVDSPDHITESTFRIAFPVIVKPEREDGSTGIESNAVVHDVKSLRDRVAELCEKLEQPAVVQRYIHGREIAVSLLGWPTPRALPPGEIVFGMLPEGHPHILTFASKWEPSSIGYNNISSVPAVLRPPELRRVAAIGRRAFDVLGLRDYGRVDVRLDERGVPYVIDVNPNCDLSSDGGFGLASARAGLTHFGFLWEILRGARSRCADGTGLFASRRSPRMSRAFAARRRESRVAFELPAEAS